MCRVGQTSDDPWTRSKTVVDYAYTVLIHQKPLIVSQYPPEMGCVLVSCGAQHCHIVHSSPIANYLFNLSFMGHWGEVFSLKRFNQNEWIFHKLVAHHCPHTLACAADRVRCLRKKLKFSFSKYRQHLNQAQNKYVVSNAVVNHLPWICRAYMVHAVAHINSTFLTLSVMVCTAVYSPVLLHPNQGPILVMNPDK